MATEVFSGAVRPTSIEQKEHVEISNVGAKRVIASGYDGTNIHDLATDTNGILKIATGFNLPLYDYVSQTQDTLTDTWVFKTGGASGTTVATIVITYTTSAKTIFQSIARS